jgi:hypothetical protein
MGLESAASHSLVSSSSPKLPNSSPSAIFDFFEVFVTALLVEVGPSDGRAAATSFKAVVRDFCDFGAALERRLERGVLSMYLSRACGTNSCQK